MTDGFTGNVSLKTAEGIAKMVNHMLRQELLGSMRGKVGAMVARTGIQGAQGKS